jgi:hypothetical protein
MLIPLGFLAGSGGEAGSDFELIESVILGSAQSSVTFSGLGTYSSTYKHLQIRAACLFSATDSTISVRLNGDSGSNYAHHTLFGNGSSVTSNAFTSGNVMMIHYNQDNNSTNEPGVVVADFLDVYSTTKNKTVRSLGGTASGTYKNQIRLNSGVWMNTASVTSLSVSHGISFTGWANANFRAGTRISLYGVK